MSILTGEPYSATVVALRHTELLAVPRELFERLVALEHKFLAWLTRELVIRLRKTTRSVARPRLSRTIAFIPVDSGVPIDELTASVIAGAYRYGHKAYRLDTGHADQPMEWFEAIEANHTLAIYQTQPLDMPGTSWTRFCLEQVDRIVLVAAAGRPVPSTWPHAERRHGLPLPVDLVLVHQYGDGRSGRVLADHTAYAHLFHVREGSAADHRRVARHLIGNSTGIVLSGGAARGFAHVGAIRALRAAGVPIDRIGGTSMGAIIGAGVAGGWDDAELHARVHKAFVANKPLSDYTIPWVALFRGRKVDKLLLEHFGERKIEELWHPFFAVSTNLTRGAARVHRDGLVRHALRASVALPGVLPPVLENNDILVDGGVVDNLPVGVMAAWGSGPIIAIDVSADQALTPGSEVPPTRSGLLSWLRPAANPLPGIVSLLSRVGTVSSAVQEATARTEATLLISPPLGGIPLLDWNSFDRAVLAGYDAAMIALQAADRQGLGVLPEG